MGLENQRLLIAQKFSANLLVKLKRTLGTYLLMLKMIKGLVSRGSTRDGTGVHDSIVNQLLSKIDGVEALNNVLLILRPGRLEVQIEISLPDENGRLQIIQIHTNKMKESSFLAPDVNLQELVCREASLRHDRHGNYGS